MERTQILELMSTLKLYGMQTTYDEVMNNAIKRQHEPPQIVCDLLQSEIEDFDFAQTPVNERLIRDLSAGTLAAYQRNVVLVGRTGTGKTHLAIAIARALIRSGTPGRF